MDTNTIGLIVISCAISSLFTVFIKSLSEPKGIKSLREKQATQEAKIQALTQGQIFIITKLGGSPKDIGLL